MRKLAAIALVLSLAAGVALAQASSARFSSLGHKMICGCGCNQILLECNHVGCPLSDGMRNELMTAIQRGDSDSLILQGFVQKYGPTILAAPAYAGFGKVAWITPFVVLLLGFGAAIVIIKIWRQPRLAQSHIPAMPSDYAERIRKETEL